MIRGSLPISLAELERIIQKRKRQLHRLTRERRRAEAVLRKIDQEITRIGGNGNVSGGGRARNAMSLARMIEAILQEAAKPLSISDIIAAVTRRGYQSTSSNFRQVVSLTLIKDARFKNVDRGVYALKSSSAVGKGAGSKRAKRRRKKRRASSPPTHESAAKQVTPT